MLRIRADLHTHSIGEATFGARTADLVARHIDAAVEVGLDCIAVSDHNDLRPGLMAREYAERRGYQLLVLPSMELTTAERVHLVAIGLSEPVEAWQPLIETITAIKQLGTISVLPHPFYAALRARRDVDAIERFNSRYGDFDLNGTHVIRNALLPVVTVLGTQAGFLLGGTVILEQIFLPPGLGRVTLFSISVRDYPQIEGNIIVIVLMVVVLNLLIDLSYAWLDPRIRY